MLHQLDVKQLDKRSCLCMQAHPDLFMRMQPEDPKPEHHNSCFCPHACTSRSCMRSSREWALLTSGTQGLLRDLDLESMRVHKSKEERLWPQEKLLQGAEGRRVVWNSQGQLPRPLASAPVLVFYQCSIERDPKTHSIQLAHEVL